MKTVQERFDAKYIPEPNSGCWLWEGHLRGRDKFRYGGFQVGNRDELAHRVSYVLHKGDIPDDMVIRHTCDNTYCVNPDHLLLGTQADNIKDREARNRGADTKGSKHPNSKLIESDVLEIRFRDNAGESHKSIAEDFPVCRSTIAYICSRKLWSHI